MKKHLTEEQIKTLLNALELAEGKPTLYLDMDGVVADFEKTAGIWGEKLGLTAKEFADKKLYRQPNFYAELELMPGAKEAIEELDKHFQIRFLSAPSWSNPHSFIEKRIWVEKNFGEWGYKRMDLTFRKDRSIGHYLVDDRTKYGASNFIGEHIMFGTEPFNGWEEVTKYLIAKIKKEE